MLDFLKQIGQLKSLQQQMKQQQFESSSNGVTVVVNGALEVLEIRCNPELDLSGQADAIKISTNAAIKKAQQYMAGLISGMPK